MFPWWMKQLKKDSRLGGPIYDTEMPRRVDAI